MWVTRHNKETRSEAPSDRNVVWHYIQASVAWMIAADDAKWTNLKGIKWKGPAGTRRVPATRCD